MSAHQKAISSVASLADVCQAANTQQSFHHKWENVLLIKALYVGQQYRSTTGFSLSVEDTVTLAEECDCEPGVRDCGRLGDSG